MRLWIVLPKVNPEAITVSTRYVYPDCSGREVSPASESHESATRYGVS